MLTLQDPNRLYSTAGSLATASAKHSKHNTPTIQYKITLSIDT